MFPLFIFSLGEVVVFLFVVLFVIAIPVVIGGAIIYALRKNAKGRVAWQEVSKKLGLTMPNPKIFEMFGTINGVDVRIAIGKRRSGGQDSTTEVYTYTSSKFPHSLRFQLSISAPKGFFSSSSMKLGQEAFDKTFVAECYHQDVLRRLLLTDFPSNKTQNLMGELMLASYNVETISIKDEVVYLENSGLITDTAVVQNMVETTASLVSRFSAARDVFPLAEWETNTLNEWQKLADGAKLTLDRKAFRIEGNFEGFHLKLAMKTKSGIWQTELVLRFPQSLKIGLKIFPENAIHKVFAVLGVQDIKSGIKKFDDAFIVKAENAVVAKGKLTAEFCGQLFGLCDKTSAFIIDDEQIAITIDDLLREEDILKGYVLAMSRAAKLLSS